MELTGRFWFKRTWSGKLILLVEERRPRRRLFGKGGPEFKLRWRDAKLLDFADLALSPLVVLAGSSATGLDHGSPGRVSFPSQQSRLPDCFTALGATPPIAILELASPADWRNACIMLLGAG